MNTDPGSRTFPLSLAPALPGVGFVHRVHLQPRCRPYLDCWGATELAMLKAASQGSQAWDRGEGSLGLAS